jgi:hypothetical protein
MTTNNNSPNFDFFASLTQEERKIYESTRLMNLHNGSSIQEAETDGYQLILQLRNRKK